MCLQAEKPKLVVGIDPSLKAWLEFQAFRRFIADEPVPESRLQFIVGLSDDVLEHAPFSRCDMPAVAETAWTCSPPR